jgi:hypothetical protein
MLRRLTLGGGLVEGLEAWLAIRGRAPGLLFVLLVCRIAGHVRPETTAAYDRRPAEAQRAAIESLSLRAFQKSRRRDLED